MKLLNLTLIGLFFLLTISGTSQPSETGLLQILEDQRKSNSPKINPCDFIDNKNLTEKVKTKILSLLRNEWVQDELDLLIIERFNKETFRNSFEGQFWHVGVKDSIIKISMDKRLFFDSAYHYVYDSLMALEKRQIKEKILNEPVSNELIALAAHINLKDAIPIFKIGLKSGNKIYDNEMLELALAKMGDDVLYKKILKEASYNNELKDFDSSVNRDDKAWTKDFKRKFFKLSFLSTQESLFQLHDWLDTSKVSFLFGLPNGNKQLGSSSFLILIYLVRYFQNDEMLKAYKNIDEFDDIKTKAFVLSFKKWMIENKGKFKVKQCN